MCTRDPLLWQLLHLVDTVPQPPPPSKRRRGCPVTYPDTLFLRILLVMVLRRFHRVHEVHAFLSQTVPPPPLVDENSFLARRVVQTYHRRP